MLGSVHVVLVSHVGVVASQAGVAAGKGVGGRQGQAEEEDSHEHLEEKTFRNEIKTKSHAKFVNEKSY